MKKRIINLIVCVSLVSFIFVSSGLARSIDTTYSLKTVAVSSSSSADFAIASPVANPGMGTYTKTIQVVFKKTTNSTNIYYMLMDPMVKNNSNEVITVEKLKKGWIRWDKKTPITIDKSKVLRAVAVEVIPNRKPTTKISKVATFKYLIKNKNAVKDTKTIFEDKNFENVIRKALNKPTGDINPDELSSITKLEAEGANIKSVRGIRYCKNLKFLSLPSNSISDITELKDITTLEWIDLKNNKIENIEPLRGLIKVETLFLNKNQIGSVDSLKNLNKLMGLHLDFNKISDINALKNLNSLRVISARACGLTSFGEENGFEGITYLNLERNNIRNYHSFAKFKKLQVLFIDAYDIKDVSPFKGFPSLMSITASSFYSVAPINFTKYEQLIKKSDEIINKTIRPGMSDDEKLKAIHDYIVDNTIYDYAAAEGKGGGEDWGNAYGVLVDKSGICSGYAAAMNLLLNRIGIETYYLGGTTTSGIGHAWNIVKIDGKYYQVDATWDDTGSTYEYFKVSDDKMSQSRTWNKDEFPKCESISALEDDKTNPKVISSTPSNGAAIVKLDQVIKIKFSKPISISGISGSITVKDSYGNDMVRGYVVNQDEIELNTTALALGTTYTVNVDSGIVMDSVGRPNEPYAFSFTTTNIRETIPPAVIRTTPENGEINVLTEPTIDIIFSEWVEWVDPSVKNASIRDSIGKEISMGNSSMSSGKFSFRLQLQHNTKYTVTIPVGMFKDAAGNLNPEYSFSFTTRNGK